VPWLPVPLAPLALAFATGVALAPLAPERAIWWAWGLSLIAAAVLSASGRCGLAALPFLLATGVLGALRATPPPMPLHHVARLCLPTTGRIEGRLVAEPTRWAPDRTRLLVEIERVGGLPGTGRIQATVYGEGPALTEGQRLAAEWRLREAVGFRNPGVFDYGAYLAREGIHVVGTGRADRVVPLDDPTPPWPVRVKRRALDVMREALPPTSAALLGGLLLGDRTTLPHDLTDAFRRAGVYHVLAVSGFNVVLLASSVFTLLVVARAGRRVAATAAIVAVIGFAFVVGPEPSVLRATIMGVLVLGAILLEREPSVLNSLALAALIVLAVRPGDLFDPGFQLSFAATAGIVLMPLPRSILLGALAVSVAAQLAVLPVTLFHFNQVSTIGVIANLAVVPLAGMATIVGLAGTALAMIAASGGNLLLNAAWPVLVALRAVVMVAASVPGAVIHLPAPPWTAVMAYASALGLALFAWKRRANPAGRAWAFATSAAMLFLTAAALEAWPIIRPGDGQLRITVLDVGQGDAIVVETPDRRAAVIDAGPGGPHRLDTGERVVAPFLWNRGHLSLAAAVVTHADLDHAGGMAAIRRRFRVADSGIAETLSRAHLGGIEVTALSDPSLVVAGHDARTRNDAALALRLELGFASFLLASDITARTESELLRRRTPLAATVLKVAHHGARGSTTSEFLAAVRPLIAVISVGTRGTYGHPSPEVIARLVRAGATIYRTDRDGAVIFETDGRSLKVTTWASRRHDRYCLDPETIC
jgi:competence protein ComEC